MKADKKKVIKWSIVFGTIALLIVIYKVFNPIDSIYFPKCIFLSVTGLECPGCGSQRAIHHLLNLELSSAFRQNLLLVASIPYLIVGFIFDLIRPSNEKAQKWRKRLFGEKAIYVLLAIIVLFTVLRNIL